MGAKWLEVQNIQCVPFGRLLRISAPPEWFRSLKSFEVPFHFTKLPTSSGAEVLRLANSWRMHLWILRGLGPAQITHNTLLLLLRLSFLELGALIRLIPATCWAFWSMVFTIVFTELLLFLSKVSLYLVFNVLVAILEVWQQSTIYIHVFD